MVFFTRMGLTVRVVLEIHMSVVPLDFGDPTY